MGSFKIDDLSAKSVIVDADLCMIGDSEDLVGSDKTIKKLTMANLKSYTASGIAIKYLTNSDSPYTIGDTDIENTFICDTSGGNVDVILPTLSANLQEGFEFIHQTGGNTLNIDGEGAETIDGLADIDLPKQGDRLKVAGTTSEWAILDERISCQLRLNTYAGYGSTDSAIMRFTNLVDNFGNLFTENHVSGYNSNAEGLKIIIAKSGKYALSFTCRSDAALPMYFGFSKNSSQLTTSITSITVADVLAYDSGTPANAGIGCASWSGHLAQNDIIHAHALSTATPGNAAQVHFCISYIGN